MIIESGIMVDSLQKSGVGSAARTADDGRCAQRSVLVQANQ